jgi:hypothetical protein
VGKWEVGKWEVTLLCSAVSEYVTVVVVAMDIVLFVSLLQMMLICDNHDIDFVRDDNHVFEICDGIWHDIVPDLHRIVKQIIKLDLLHDSMKILL